MIEYKDGHHYKELQSGYKGMEKALITKNVTSFFSTLQQIRCLRTHCDNPTTTNYQSIFCLVCTHTHTQHMNKHLHKQISLEMGSIMTLQANIVMRLEYINKSHTKRVLYNITES